jgi:SPP1 family predicted phage head-tail adaptor
MRLERGYKHTRADQARCPTDNTAIIRRAAEWGSLRCGGIFVVAVSVDTAMISAQSLRHKLTIQSTTQTQASDGSVIDTWGTFATAWGEVKPLSGREYFSAQAEGSSVSHKIKIRYIAGITTKMRVLWGARVFDIEAALNSDEGNRELILMCVEGVD